MKKLLCAGKKRKGFTLIELITVMFIFAVLASIMIPNMRRAYFRARLSGCQSNLRNLATAISQYEVDKKHYPDELSEVVPTYIKAVPECPVAEIDTYSEGYLVTTDRDIYTIHCKGENHTIVNLGTDEPWYSPSSGLGPNY